MPEFDFKDKTLGWVGTGRMGYAIATRLLEAGCDLAVYNRTRAKAVPLAELGAKVVDTPAELASRDIVFTMVAGSEDFQAVVIGENGLLSSSEVAPSMIVDSSTVSSEASAEVRAQTDARGVALLAARVTYVGDGDRARLVKICHNLMLGVVAQTLAEITVLAEKGGVSRADFFDFFNDSVMGSMFSRYKTPAYVNLDFKPTFTPALLLKDFRLGADAAREHDVPMPVSAAAQQVVQSLIGNGYHDIDFAALLELQARGSGLELVSEDAPVTAIV